MWQLAVLYADARGDGLSLVDARLAREPRDMRARMARALLLHLDGRHADAGEASASLLADVPASDGMARSHVLRFLGDERSELGQWDAALQAYHDAMRAGGAAFDPATLDDDLFVAGMGGNADSLLDLIDAACAAGRENACTRAAKIRLGAGFRERTLRRRDGRTP